jgi:hypothetical protein
MISEDELVLVVKGLGAVPAFKNKKIIVGKRLITAPKARQWMVSAVSNMYSQLKSLYQTSGGATSTVRWQQSATALLPYDDNWKAIPEITVKVRMVEKGEEGAIIRLTRLSPA